jgi:hypothetical protein
VALGQIIGPGPVTTLDQGCDDVLDLLNGVPRLSDDVTVHTPAGQSHRPRI